MKNIITINDDVCKDMMEYDVLCGEFITDDTPIFERFKNGVNYDFLWLTTNDKELLIKYAPKLFNTFQNIDILKNSMYQLAKHISDYRFEKHHYKEQQQEVNQYSHSHKKFDEKYEILQGHIKAILNMIGSDYLPNEEKYKALRTSKDAFIEELNKAYCTPYDYLPRREFYRPDKTKPYSKKSIRDYLIELKLPNKSKIIEEFLKKIKNA